MRPIPPVLCVRLRFGGGSRRVWSSQVASMVTRWTQALVHEKEHCETAARAPARAQLYVDGPATVSWRVAGIARHQLLPHYPLLVSVGDSTFVEQGCGA